MTVFNRHLYLPSNFAMNKSFGVIFLSLCIIVISEKPNVMWISFKEYSLTNAGASEGSLNRANIFSVPCRSSQVYVGKKCRKIYYGVREICSEKWLTSNSSNKTKRKGFLKFQAIVLYLFIIFTKTLCLSTFIIFLFNKI